MDNFFTITLRKENKKANFVASGPLQQQCCTQVQMRHNLILEANM